MRRILAHNKGDFMGNARRWELEPSQNFCHLSLGLKVEIPRHTKHNHHRYIITVRVLFWGLSLKRLNEQRIPKRAPVPLHEGNIDD